MVSFTVACTYVQRYLSTSAFSGQLYTLLHYIPVVSVLVALYYLSYRIYQKLDKWQF